jgi:Protein of unknown function (DUF1571)
MSSSYDLLIFTSHHLSEFATPISVTPGPALQRAGYKLCRDLGGPLFHPDRRTGIIGKSVESGRTEARRATGLDPRMLTEEIANMSFPAFGFVGRAMAMSILGLLVASGRAHPQSPTPVERAGQLLAESQASLTRVRDYTGTLVREERIDGQLQEEQFIKIRVRQQPYSARLNWTSPKHLAGQEAIYVTGKNDGEIRAKGTGILAVVGYVSLPTNDPRVMKNSRHAITETGIGNLIKIISQSYEIERRLPAGQVTATFGEYAFQRRQCTRMEITNHAFDAKLYCYRCIVYFDKEYKLPIRVEVYDWPKPKGDPKGELLECYSYIDLKFNVGLTDAAFMESNK